MSTVVNSIERTVTKKLSERWSVLDFGAVGNGVTDDSAAINDAIASAAADGGREVYFPGGRTYLLGARLYISDTMANVTLSGDGDATVLKRGATITAGQGLVDVWGQSIAFRALKVDGNVLTSTSLQYGAPGDFNNDPQNNALSQNTSFWVHGGARRVRFYGVTITHTGGYAILLDARDADIWDARIEACLLENNRPHLFGTDAGDKNYGAWTGGILLQGDCRAGASKLFSVRGAQIRGNRFHRMNGNCIWMHSYGFDTQHENVVVEGNEFAYIARDAYLAGNLRGGSCTGNTARYVGFRHTTDSDTPVGAYLANHYAVGFDASGYVSDHPMVGNTVVEFYGGGFDLDGLRDSVVANNTATSSQAIAKGLQTGDTSANGGGQNVVIKGNRFSGCNAGSIVLNQADGCLCEGNVIDHPAGASVVPILLFSTNKQTKNTTVRHNDIYYPADNWCVVEDDSGTGTGFDSTTANIVYGNRYRGARGEFLKIAASASVTGFVLSTNSASATTKQETTLQREGTGATAAWKVYDQQGGTRKQYAQMQFSNGLFNVSEDGAVQTGIVTTAARSTLGFKDAVWTGKLMGDGFLALYDYAGASTSYQAADANSLSADWALIRFNKTAGKWEQSLSVSAGARVWADFTGGGGVAGLTAGRIPYAASATSLADSANLTWNNTNRVLTVTGATGTAGIVVATAFVQSAEGFYTPATATDSIQSPSGGVTARFLIGTRSFTLTGDTAANAGLSSGGQGRIYFDSGVNKFRVSENGGAYVDLLGSGGSIAGLTAGRVPYASTATTLADTANLTWNNTNQFLQVASSSIAAERGIMSSQHNDDVQTAGLTLRKSRGTLASPTAVVNGDFVGALTAQGYDGSTYQAGSRIAFRMDAAVSGGSVPVAMIFQTGTSGGGTERMRITSAGNVLVATATDDSSGAKLQVTGFVSATTGFYTVSTATDSIKSPSGGVTARFLIGTRSFTLTGDTAANAGLSSAGQGRIYFDSSSNKFRVSENGGAYVDLVSGAGVTSLTGTANQVNVSAATGAVTLSLPQNIHTGASPTFSYQFLTGLVCGAHATISSGNRTHFTGFSYGGIIVGGAGAGTFYSVSVGGNNRSAGATCGVFSFHSMGQDVVMSSSVSARIDAICDSSNSTEYGAHLDFTTVKSLSASGSSTAVRMRILSGGNVLIGTTSDDGSGGRLQVTGFVSATTGFYTVSTATDSIKSPSGGVTARFLIGTRSFTLTGDTAANAGLSSAGQGRIYFDSSSNKFRVSESGGAYVDLLGASGVSSLAGTTNQVNVSASTGAVTLSLPQNIHTSASVQFYSVLTSDAIQSNRFTGPAIYAPNAYIQGKGLVSSGLAAYNSIQTDAGVSAGAGSGGGFYLAATQVINTSGQFVGLGVNMPSYGVAASGFNPNYFGTQYYGQNLGAVSVRRGDDTGSGTLTIYGGVIVAASGL